MTLAAYLLLVTLVMRFWPETATGRWLQRNLIDYPRSRLSRIKRQHIIFSIVVFLLAMSLAEAGMAHFAPFMAVDISAYVDALITAWTVAALTRTKGGWMALRARLPRLPRSQPRRRRNRTQPMALRRANDDDEDGHGAWALAA